MVYEVEEAVEDAVQGKKKERKGVPFIWRILSNVKTQLVKDLCSYGRITHGMKINSTMRQLPKNYRRKTRSTMTHSYTVLIRMYQRLFSQIGMCQNFLPKMLIIKEKVALVNMI